MLFEFRCVNCDEVLRAQTRFVGRMSRCPNCKNRLIVPELDSDLVLRIIRDEVEEVKAPVPEREAEEGPRETLIIGEEDLITPETLREVINAILQRRYGDVLWAIPRWGIAIALHAIAILLIATFGVISLSGDKPVRRIPSKVQSYVTIPEPPPKMQDVKIDRDAVPDFKDVLANASSATSKPIESLEKQLGVGGGEGPQVIGIDDPLAPVVRASVGRGIGPGAPGGSGRDRTIFEVKGSGARSVVFIVDASGSMLRGDPGRTRWDLAVKELRDSITALTFGHLFNVYFSFYCMRPEGNVYYYRWKEAPVVATPENKLDCFNFIDRVDQEARVPTQNPMAFTETDIVQATKDALKSNPETIFLLSDAEFRELIRGQHTPADDIRKLNPDRGCRIYTICFKERSGERIMKRIADENRGRYKFVP